jgi:ribonuclease P protein subunit RPR2
MAKAKAGTVQNKALYSRVSYLYQAATYLATQQQHSRTSTGSSQTENGKDLNTPDVELERPSGQALQAASRHLITDLRTVSLKAQLRMSPAMKHSICKNCDTMLIDGSTCTSEVENRSKGGKKPWADVLVRKCNICGFARRFPVAAERQKRRPLRSQDEQIGAQNDKDS